MFSVAPPTSMHNQKVRFQTSFKVSTTAVNVLEVRR